MASSQPACPSAQVVANAFVHQYYHILHQSPELVYRFYQDSSVLGRPEAEGRMSSVTTMQAINEKILSLDYSDLKAEIKTVDAQKSLNEGVLVLVTGYLTGKDNVRRNFTQTFFLAPQDKGYFVLNDVFRYTEDSIPHEDVNQGEANDTNPPLTPEQASENQTTEPTNSWETEEVAHEEVYNPSDNEEGSVVEEEAPVPELVDEAPDDSQLVPNTNTNVVQEEAPKKSYASIVKVMKESSAPMSAPTHAPQRSGPPYAERLPAQSLAVAAPAEMPTSNTNVSESGGILEGEGADGYSIYIKSLPLNATPAQLDEEFKRFGPIKKDGVQVRSNKQQGFCYGFVEFEVASAVQSAIEASPITIGGRQAHVEEKRPSGSRVSNRARYPSGGRGGGYRNDSGRGGGGGGGGRGNYWNSRNYGGRGEYGSSGGGGGSGSGSGRGEFNNNRGGVGRGVPPGRGEGGYKAKPASTPRVSASA